MDYNTLQEGIEAVSQPLEIDPRSLYRAFEEIRDGRSLQGKRYSLALVLTLILLGKLAGETTLSGIAP